MKVLIRGVHLQVSDRTKNYVEEHLASHMARFFDDPAAELEVHLVDGNGPKRGLDKECRVTVRIPGLPSIHVEEASETLFQAIDAVRDRLEVAAKRSIQRRRDLASAGADSR